ncbi:MAG TPA: cold shock domain-containing protein [Candidatus Paceibacterota bacterium]
MSNPDGSVVEQSSQESEEQKGTVKWFDPLKGFGFVLPESGGADAFLHMSCLERCGHATAYDGATVVYRTVTAPKGPKVSSVISMDDSTAVVPEDRRVVPKRLPWVEVTVVWYDADKSFGYVTRGDSTPDIRINALVLQTAGIVGLQEGQRLLVCYASEKGVRKAIRALLPK